MRNNIHWTMKSQVAFSRITMGPGAAVAFGLVNKSAERGKKASTLPVFALAGPPSGCMINFETLVRPALLKMRGYADVAHPSVEATAMDSIPQKMPMSFVRWTRLTRNGKGYRVTLNPPEGTGPLATITAANSLTLVPEGVFIKAGDRVKVLPLDWMGIPCIGGRKK